MQPLLKLNGSELSTMTVLKVFLEVSAWGRKLEKGLAFSSRGAVFLKKSKEVHFKIWHKEHPANCLAANHVDFGSSCRPT